MEGRCLTIELSVDWLGSNKVLMCDLLILDQTNVAFTWINQITVRGNGRHCGHHYQHWRLMSLSSLLKRKPYPIILVTPEFRAHQRFESNLFVLVHVNHLHLNTQPHVMLGFKGHIIKMTALSMPTFFFCNLPPPQPSLSQKRWPVFDLFNSFIRTL